MLSSEIADLFSNTVHLIKSDLLAETSFFRHRVSSGARSSIMKPSGEVGRIAAECLYF